MWKTSSNLVIVHDTNCVIFVLFVACNGIAQVDCEQFTAAFGFSPNPEGISSLIVLPQWRSGFFYTQGWAVS